MMLHSKSKIKSAIGSTFGGQLAMFLILSLMLPLVFPAMTESRELNQQIVAGDYRNLPPMTRMIVALDDFVNGLFTDKKTEGSKTRNEGIKETASAPTTAELAARVKSIKLNQTSEIEINQGQSVSLSAMPLDIKGNAVHGLSVKWTSSDEKIVNVSADGQAKGLQIGTALLTVTAGRVSASVKIKVEALSSKAKLTKPLQQAAFDVESLFTPANSIGAPAGRTEQGASVPSPAVRTREKPGSASYSFGIPIAGLPGRGSDVSLQLTYNSRVWNNSGGFMNYDVDKNWLSPGFNLSYGTFDFYNPAGGYMIGVLTTPNGTRHRMRHLGSYNGVYVFEEDGTYLRYHMYYDSSGFPSGGCF